MDRYSGGGSDLDNQICIIVYADLRGRVAGNSRDGLGTISLGLT